MFTLVMLGARLNPVYLYQNEVFSYPDVNIYNDIYDKIKIRIISSVLSHDMIIIVDQFYQYVMNVANY